MAARDGGIGRLKRKLARIPKEIRDKVMVTQIEIANDLAKKMRGLAPVDTGKLRDSIEVTKEGQNTPNHSQPGGKVTVPEGAVMVTAGNNAARYVHLVEFGHDNAEPTPFFVPVIRSNRKAINAKMKRSINKAVKGSGK